MEREIRCPHCGAEWEEWRSGDGAVYLFEDLTLRRWPLGRGRCAACLRAEAGPREARRYVERAGLERRFLEWLVGDIREDDARAVWHLLARRDPELLDARVMEFVEGDEGFYDEVCADFL